MLIGFPFATSGFEGFGAFVFEVVEVPLEKRRVRWRDQSDTIYVGTFPISAPESFSNELFHRIEIRFRTESFSAHCMFGAVEPVFLESLFGDSHGAIAYRMKGQTKKAAREGGLSVGSIREDQIE